MVEDVTEILIGMDWLLENAATIDFKNQRIGISGRIFGLAKATPYRAVRRVASRKTIEIPPKSEANLEGRVLYSDLADYNGSWVTKPKRLKDALLVARTLVADRVPAVVIRLVNLSSRPVLLEEGDALCELEEVTNTPTLLDENGEDAHLKKICGRVDPSVSKEDLGRLEQLMRQYQHVFSRGLFRHGTHRPGHARDRDGRK